jgi:hypothetical protein
MLGEGGTPLSRLREVVRELQAWDEPVDLKELRVEIDALEGVFCADARKSQMAGEHLVAGCVSAAAWIARTCGMSVTSAADRVCVGEQLESLPKVAAALGSGQISFQSTSVLCHLREQLGEKGDLFDEDEMLEYAREYQVFQLRKLCSAARHAADPDGFFNDAEESFLRRRLHISQMSDGLFAVDGVLDPVAGAAFKTAVGVLAKPKGPEDERTAKQRRADAVGELALHAMEQGTLPRRHSVKPHINLTMTLEALKGELGVPPADLELSLPISTRTAERLACDCTMSRVVLADSMVIDVGRATRTVSPPTMRALRVRDKGCRFPAAIARSTGPLPITSSIGLEVGRASCPTWSCSATSTIASCMRVDGRWSRPDESSSSYRPIGS